MNPKNRLMNIIPNAAYGALCATSKKEPPNNHTTDGKMVYIKTNDNTYNNTKIPKRANFSMINDF
jgi:hypothetical protein